MITQLLAFEITIQRKQWALAFAMILFFLSGLRIGSQGFAPDLLNFNAPYQLSYHISIFTLGSVFAILFFAINGVLRDHSHHIEELIYSSGIQKHHFFISRFVGVFIFSLLAVSPLIIGMAVGAHLFELDPDRVAPFQAMHYLWNWLVFVVPNVFICSVLIFSVGIITKNRMAIYATVILIYVLYFICSFFFDSPILAGAAPAHSKDMMIAAIGDPFGISAFMQQSQYLTPSQKNVVLVSLSGNFLINRLLWCLLSFGILGITYRLFSFREIQHIIKKTPNAQPETNLEKSNLTGLQHIPIRVHSSIYEWKSFLSHSKMGIKQLLKSLPFQAILVLIAFIMTSEMYVHLVERGSYSELVYPVTSILAQINSMTIFIFGFLMILFFSGEWVWKERSVDMHYILDATPASNASFFLSKASVLLCIPILLITIEILIAIAIQILFDYPRFDFSTYLSLYYFQGLPLVFYILFALFIQSLLPNKYLGMALTGIIAMLLGTSLSSSIGLEHPLVQMGSMPQVSFSDMTGVSNNASAFYLLSTHWLIFGLILMLISFHCWRRGVTDTFIEQIKQITQHWSVRQLISLGMLVVLLMSTTGMILYKTHIEEEYITSSEHLDRLAEYERKYKHYEDEEVLYPISIITDVALYPYNRSYTVHATYELLNKSDTSISKILIIGKKGLTTIQLDHAILIGQDPYLSIYEYRFNSSIMPGDTITMTYSFENKRSGLYSGNELVDNGSFVQLSDFSPTFGYSKSREISNNTERGKRGLAKRVVEQPSASDFVVVEAGYGRVQFETILSVPASQTGISVGNLMEKWTENGRNFYRYKTPLPIAPAITYHSAVYEVETEDYNGISLEHYYYHGHDVNNQSIMTSLKQTLDYAQQEFGNYHLDNLRIVELPSFWGFGGYALAGTISMVEDNLYLIDERDPAAFSLVAKRTIHEVAHQWWGHILGTKNQSGSGIFVEGFAKYTEAVVMEKYNGISSLFQLTESAHHTYFNGRSYAATPEQPLYLEQGESYMLYGKSYIVMYALKELIGEQQLNLVLKTMVDRHRNERDATITSMEFVEELYSATPIEHHTLIDDWLKKIITYDLSVTEANYIHRTDGTFDVTLTIEAHKLESIDGIESPIAMNEPVPVGLFTTHPSQANKEQIIVLEPRLIENGAQQITFRVKTLPRYVAIDPYGTRPDQIRNDNWIEL